MADLIWTRTRDGDHFGKPCYEYTATVESRIYSIVWACDHGGTFGFTARTVSNIGSNYLTKRNGIHWCRTLKNCKAECQKIEDDING